MLTSETDHPQLKQLLNLTGASCSRLPGRAAWGVFTEPLATIRAQTTVAEVHSAIEQIRIHLQEGFFAVGYIAYEAASAFDPAQVTHPAGNDSPLLYFHIYKEMAAEVSAEELANRAGPHEILPSPSPELNAEAYLAALAKVKDYIYEGDIYQANYTFRSSTSPSLDPVSLFLGLSASHPVPYAGYMDCDDFSLVSLSPELFLEQSGQSVTSKPMKGTEKRKKSTKSDSLRAEWLAVDEKNMAENVMIVDMVRNDFGRICVPGSIKVDPLFEVETYRTVHQMVSTVTGTLRDETTLWELLSATFPAASITGAPKVRAMEVIRELEKSPRGVYTGTFGYLGPDGICLNVAIRTLTCRSDSTVLGIGSGVVADSCPEDEWQESLLKGTFLNVQPYPPFEILETMLWQPDLGVPDLAEHLARARGSQLYFGRKWSTQAVDHIREELALFSSNVPQRVRLLIEKHGEMRLEWYPLSQLGWGEGPKQVCIADDVVDSGNVFLYHKTTHRDFYNEKFKQAMADGYAEVLFCNERNELTEGAISNVFLRFGDTWATPALESGLLPGIWRAGEIKRLNAEERVLCRDEIQLADEIRIGNSVRGGVEVIL